MIVLKIVLIGFAAVVALIALFLIIFSILNPLNDEEKANLKRKRDISWRQVEEHKKKSPIEMISGIIFGGFSH